MPSEQKSSAAKSLVLSFYTFLSRLLGLVRDHFMAVTFGTGWVASAFSVAYRLPNMFRNLLAEGTLSQSFMPIYSEAEKTSLEEASLTAGTILTFLFSFLSVFVSLFIIFSPYFIPLLSGGTEEYSGLIIRLSVILFFLILTASLSSVFMAISNLSHKYFVPSLSPIILNMSYLVAFFFILPNFSDMQAKVNILCYCIVAGGVLQLIIQSFYVYRIGRFPRFSFDWKHHSIGKIFKLMIPAAIGGGFYQIGLLVDIFLANYIQNQNPGLGAVVSLDYAQRLVQFPTGIIGVALATTTLPTLLSSLRKNELEKIPAELSEVISFTLFLTVPAGLAFILAGRPIIDSIFHGGRWTDASTDSTLLALQFYSAAIPFFSLNKIMTSSYYAFQDTKTPLKMNFIAFIINMILNFFLIFPLKHAGLALSSAAASVCTFSFLVYHLKKHSVHLPIAGVLKRAARFIFPISVFILVLFLLQNFLFQEFLNIIKSYGYSHANANRLYLCVLIPVSVSAYFGVSYSVKLEEFHIIFGKVLKKLKKQ